MEHLYHLLEPQMNSLTQLSILVLETIGVIIILVAALRGIVEYIMGKHDAQLRMTSAMAFALEFKLGGEILRTVLVREVSEIFIVGCIIVLRGVLNYLIHWDIREHRKEDGQYNASRFNSRWHCFFVRPKIGKRKKDDEGPGKFS